MRVSITGILLLAVAMAACEQGTARLENYEVHGIDVSHHQAAINWDSVVIDQFSFAFVKATEGATMRDTLFCDNWRHMKRVGIRRGAYHFYRPQTSALRQVDNFIYWVEIEAGDLPPVVDVEVLDGASKAQLITGLKTWLYLVELHYEVKPILYTNLKFYNKYLAGHFRDYHIWIARYNSREPVLADGRNWQFWQYGNRGAVKGINGHVDFNVFYGSHSQLRNLCAEAPPVISREKKMMGGW